MRTHFSPGEQQVVSRVATVRWMALITAFVALAAGWTPDRLMAQEVIPPDREDLLKGAGMGLAAVADRNHYPSPKQILEMKTELSLTRDQIRKAEVLDKVVSSSAVAKGEEIVQAEDELNKTFESGGVSEKLLRSKLEEIAKLRADLRFIHLQAHLRMRQILTPDQVKRYDELRPRENKPEN